MLYFVRCVGVSDIITRCGDILCRHGFWYSGPAYKGVTTLTRGRYCCHCCTEFIGFCGICCISEVISSDGIGQSVTVSVVVNLHYGAAVSGYGCLTEGLGGESGVDLGCCRGIFSGGPGQIVGVGQRISCGSQILLVVLYFVRCVICRYEIGRVGGAFCYSRREIRTPAIKLIARVWFCIRQVHCIVPGSSIQYIAENSLVACCQVSIGSRYKGYNMVDYNTGVTNFFFDFCLRLIFCVFISQVHIRIS